MEILVAIFSLIAVVSASVAIILVNRINRAPSSVHTGILRDCDRAELRALLEENRRQTLREIRRKIEREPDFLRT